MVSMKQQRPEPMILDKKRSSSTQQEEEEIVNNTRGNKRMKKTTKESITDHIIYEILLNLPVKSLLRFKSLSKQYNSLISSSSFIRDHLLRNNRSNNNRCSLLFQKDIFTFNLTGVDYDFMERREEEEHPNSKRLPSRDVMFPVSGHQESRGFEIQCCFDGIICFASSSDDYIGLWNLYTNQYKILPQLFHDKRRHSVFGFGFDSSINDYKIVRLRAVSYFPRPRGTPRQLHPQRKTIFVMSLRSNTWRKIDVPFQYHVALQPAAPTPDGSFLYWFAERFSGLGVIIAFDLVKERVIEVPMPPPLANPEDGSNNMWLGFLQGCLTFASLNKSENCFDFWMLQGSPREPATNTWIKPFTFPLSLYKGRGHIGRLRPLFTTENGAHVLHAGICFRGSSTVKLRKHLIYDPTQGTCKLFQVAGVPHRKPYSIFNIPEGLASFSS